MTFINTSRPINTAIRHAVLLIYLLFLSSVKAQQGTQDTPDPYPYAKFSPSMAIIIAVLVTALFFMGFFSIYIRRCSQSNGGSFRPTLSIRRRAAASIGLDAEVIETFPTLAYSEVKDLHIGKGALECAVCLNEFEDDEMLRLLPKCDHVFHPECIDMWLANHSTCPVCRADLVPKPGESVEPPGVLPESVTGPDSGTNITEEHPQDEFHVTITQSEDRAVDSNNMQEPKPETMKRIGSLRNRTGRSGSVRAKIFGFGNKFTRSHSTGHSLVQLGENLDRFTLRLPEEVRKEVIRRALLNRNGSSIARGEGSLKRGLRTGEGSSRGRNYRRLGSLERVVKSDRWVFSRMPSFLTRALSTRSPKVVAGAGEASTSSASAKAGGDWSGRSDEGHEASLSANDSAKLPV